MTWEAVIGLEVHAQLLTTTKMFCACPARSGDPPNTNICPVCTGQPGVLPVANGQAVELACAAALALGCTIRPRSRFARKNYFYPDLPKGYQITQYELPLAEDGRLAIAVDGRARTIGIERLHLEEDAGKSLHDARNSRTLVDLNRCGVPLIEIVSRPDLRSPDEAAEYLRQLRRLLVYLEVCEGSLERGSLRCDVNVSLRPAGDPVLGTKVEVKNLNSYRHVRDALAFEIARQTEALDRHEPIRPQTRLWDDVERRTEVMRDKEEAEDYRYFPEPDLPPLVLDERLLARVRERRIEAPSARRERLEREYGLPAYDAEVLTAHRGVADLFEETARRLAESCVDGAAKRASNFVMTEVLRGLPDEGPATRPPVDACRLAELLRLVADGTISNLGAKEGYAEMLRSEEAPAAIVARKGLAQVSDEAAIVETARRIVEAHPREAERYRAGRTNVLGFFVAQVVRELGGKGNPKLASAAVKRILEGEE